MYTNGHGVPQNDAEAISPRARTSHRHVHSPLHRPGFSL